jgi:hypothetical protein
VERPASTWGLRSGSGSLDAGFELRVTSYEVRVKYWLLVAGCLLERSGNPDLSGIPDAGFTLFAEVEELTNET